MVLHFHLPEWIGMGLPPYFPNRPSISYIFYNIYDVLLFIDHTFLNLSAYPVFLTLPLFWNVPSETLRRSLGAKPSRKGKFSLMILSFSCLMISSLQYSSSNAFLFSSSCLSCSSLNASSFSCHSLSTSLLCSCYFILLFCWASCYSLSSLANFWSIVLLNCSYIRASSSFWSLFLSFPSISACWISYFCLCFFSASYLFFLLISASISYWYSSLFRFS